MQFNDKGLQLIKDFEGFSASPYLCPAGVPTIGYGSTHYHNGSKVSINDVDITERYASFMLMNHVEKECITPIKNFLDKRDIELNDNQFSALVSFAYNVGHSFVTIKGSVRKALIQNRLDDVPAAILLYCRARVNGELVVMGGLKRRRDAEAELFKLN